MSLRNLINEYKEIKVKRQPLKYKPGKHYNISSEALIDNDSSMIAVKDGQEVGQGSVNKADLKALENAAEKVSKSGKKRVFYVPYTFYLRLRNKMIKDQEKYIEDNNIEIK